MQRTAIVTGASRGLGKALALGFLDARYNVVVCSRSAATLDAAGESFARHGDRVLLRPCDVSREADVIDLVSATVERFGGLHVLVNNAGVYGPIGDITDLDSQAWSDAMQTNVMGVFHACKHAVPHMRKEGFGRIINVSGGGATKPMPGYSSYCASKAAVVRFTETLALELDADGILVNSIAPGFIATDIHKATLESPCRAIEQFQRLTREKLAAGGDDPQKAVALALMLASDRCRLNGKLVSAVFDPWETFGEQPAVSPDFLTLRRVDNVFISERTTPDKRT